MSAVPNATLANVVLCASYFMWTLWQLFFFNVEKGLLVRPTVISKKKEGSLQTHELKKSLMYLRYCEGQLVLSHLQCLFRNYLQGHTAQQEGSADLTGWAQPLSCHQLLLCPTYHLQDSASTLPVPDPHCFYEAQMPTRTFIQTKDTSTIFTILWRKLHFLYHKFAWFQLQKRKGRVAN